MDNDPIPVFINKAGGAAAAFGDALAGKIEAAFATAGRPVALRLVQGVEMKAAVMAAADAPIVVVGGGDGTLGCAADALLSAGGRAALGVLPLGTRNHLAVELGVPTDLPGAAKLIVAGSRRRIDVGRVNDRLFLNNASIGLYPRLVEGREAEQRRHGVPKWVANVPAAWRALRRIRHHRLTLCRDGREDAIRTPLLFVGNNRYELSPGRLGSRRALDDGVLSIYAVGSTTRAGLMLFAARLALGLAERARDFAALGDAAAFDVKLHGSGVAIALDGETMRLEGPLRFRVDPGALTVIAPPA